MEKLHIQCLKVFYGNSFVDIVNNFINVFFVEISEKIKSKKEKIKRLSTIYPQIVDNVYLKNTKK